MTKPCKDTDIIQLDPHMLHHLITKRLKTIVIIIIRINIIQQQFEAIIEKQFLCNSRNYLLFHEGTSLYAINNSSFQDMNIVYRFIVLILQNMYQKSLSQLIIILHMH